jgi:hypothetical protein
MDILGSLALGRVGLADKHDKGHTIDRVAPGPWPTWVTSGASWNRLGSDSADHEDDGGYPLLMLGMLVILVPMFPCCPRVAQDNEI